MGQIFKGPNKYTLSAFVTLDKVSKYFDMVCEVFNRTFLETDADKLYWYYRKINDIV